MNHCRHNHTVLRIEGMIAVALLALSWLGPALAAPLLLPPRPTPMPPSAALPAGGAIVLQVQGDLAAWPALWTLVEWEDEQGAWHPVEGWVGPLDTVTATGGEKGWGIPPEYFGQGPFRWVIYTRQGGDRLVQSAAFLLPGQPGETTVVTMAVVAALLPASGGKMPGALWVGPGLVLLAGVLLLRRRGATSGR